jgi:hypothetical protein
MPTEPSQRYPPNGNLMLLAMHLPGPGTDVQRAQEHGYSVMQVRYARKKAAEVLVL